MDDEAKTPADRLERALRDHEAKKRAAADSAAQRAEEAARLEALQAQVDALPPHERRAVLEAAGLNRKPAAPKPDTPVRGGGFVPGAREQPIRWAAWLALPHVELWQAVALCTGIEPAEGLRPAVRRGWSRFSRLPEQFFERLRHCERAISFDGPIRPQGSPYMGMLNDPFCDVSLSEVATFLTLAEYEMPEQVRPRPPAEPEANRGGLIKRDALVAKHERAWPTIDRDLKDASENGLSAEAKADAHGMWWEGAALAWAAARGKLRETGSRTPASPFSGLGS